jgi:hypothetical protein
MFDCYRPILLKKSASVFTAEKFVPEIEACALGKQIFSTESTQSGQS